jgi:hypothetical protein
MPLPADTPEKKEVFTSCSLETVGDEEDLHSMAELARAAGIACGTFGTDVDNRRPGAVLCA